MREYFKYYGPINGIVLIGLGTLLFSLNILLIEFSETTIRLLMFAPVPLLLTGISLLLFPGAKLTRKKIHDENLSFWKASPNSHKFFWLLLSVTGVLFLVLQLLSFFGWVELPINNCFLSNYLGIGSCPV